MGFWNFGDLRTLLDTETDHDSPGSEELVSQIRENIEALFMLVLGTGTSGTATSDPINSTAGYFYDTAGGYADDEHNGRTLVILSGSAKGNSYTIDDTVASVHRLACTGDNLYADGVRSGDSYIILYDVKVNTDGHDHDGINSCAPVLANNSIANFKLHTATSSASGSLTAGSPVSITMHDYSFFPSIQTNGTGPFVVGGVTSGGDTVGRFSIGGDTSDTYAVYWRYVTATDEPFLYAIRDRATGEIIHLWTSEDPPDSYKGCDATPEDFVPPIVIKNADGTPWLDPEKHEEVVCWKVEKAVLNELMGAIAGTGAKGCKSVGERFDFVKGKAIRRAVTPPPPNSPRK